jgi:elongation factor 1-gamma
LKLTGKLASFRTSKIVMVATEAGLDLEVVEINTIADTKTEEYLKKNPTGKIPFLETEEGNVFESRTIMRHLARLSGHKSLMG